MSTELFSNQVSPNTDSLFYSDGETVYRLSKFNTKLGKPINLTNDERKALLAIINPKKNLRKNKISTAVGLGFAVFGAIFGLIISIEFRFAMGILAVCFALPGLIAFGLGIYRLATTPNPEKCQINAYEFTVDAIYTSTLVYSVNPAPPVITRVLSISAQESARFMSDPSHSSTVILYFGGNNVKLLNQESFAALRHGIAVNDKIRCAVLENGNHCFITVY